MPNKVSLANPSVKAKPSKKFSGAGFGLAGMRGSVLHSLGMKGHGTNASPSLAKIVAPTTTDRSEVSKAIPTGSPPKRLSMSISAAGGSKRNLVFSRISPTGKGSPQEGFFPGTQSVEAASGLRSPDKSLLADQPL